MAKHKVTNAIFTYRNSAGKRISAVRGDVIDLPDEVFEKYQDAFIPADADLANPGRLVELRDDASAESIDNYLRSGSSEEIMAQLPGYTEELKGKVLLAEQSGEARSRLLEALGVEPVVVVDSEAEAKKKADAEAAAKAADEEAARKAAEAEAKKKADAEAAAKKK